MPVLLQRVYWLLDLNGDEPQATLGHTVYVLTRNPAYADCAACGRGIRPEKPRWVSYQYDTLGLLGSSDNPKLEHVHERCWKQFAVLKTLAS